MAAKEMNTGRADAKGTDRFYLWEDIYIRPGRITHYMPNQGNEWSFDPKKKFHNFGMFGHLRPMGKAPRGNNLWEGTWDSIVGMLTQQYGKAPPAHGFEQWWIRSNVDRAGGWDRLMLPGAADVPIEQIARGMPRPCIVQQIVRLRQGARDDYLDWVGRKLRPAAERVGWKVIKSMGAIHASLAINMLGAPDWSRTLDLAAALPQPDPAWQADVDTHALQAWAGSTFLKR